LKNYKKRKKIEDDVLKIYRKVSPSHRNITDSQSKVQFFNQRITLFKTLGLPLSFFKNKKVLEIGGGTGEKALFYAFYGADVTIVEPNEKSCLIAKKIFSQTKLTKKLTVINKSLFDIDLSDEEIASFDQLKNKARMTTRSMRPRSSRHDSLWSAFFLKLVPCLQQLCRDLTP